MEKTSGLVASNNEDNEKEELHKLVERQRDAMTKLETHVDTLSALPESEKKEKLWVMIQMANDIIRRIKSKSSLFMRKTCVEQYEVSVDMIGNTIKMITDDNSGLVASNNEDDEEGKLLGEELGEHAKKQLMGIMDTAASIVKITDDSGIRGIINMVTDGNHTQLSGWMDNQTLQTLSRDFINPNGLGRNKDS
ncbi:hypothetical protein TGAM01_v211104 [Trichoderma gamsii]|uniref:Uncharacterized protein n=2 Tax=Trichoderma gamsii TaxID=398673 RepID=A0A2P4Z6W7_9HYPO|nr:hypothetical protein TGAM01_v211104 [Trichoderma gamsii]PON20027.1 hypothetical protein TGAM01_v211104 [Trichoderma gamsii]